MMFFSRKQPAKGRRRWLRLSVLLALGAILWFAIHQRDSRQLARALTAMRAGPAEEKHLDGITYQHYQFKDVPWSIHVVRIDRTRPDFELGTTLAQGTRIGLNTLSQQVRSVPPEAGQPRAAINGDFYQTEQRPVAGDPRGLQILRGELISAPGEMSCVWIDPFGRLAAGEVKSEFEITWPNGDRTPFGLNEAAGNKPAILYTAAMGDMAGSSRAMEFVLENTQGGKFPPLEAGQTVTARIRTIHHEGKTRPTGDTLLLSMDNPNSGALAAKAGDTISISTATQPGLKGVRTAVGGGPVLLHRAEVQSCRARRSGERHPRSAIGWNKTELFFVQVDGRQPSLSIGMSLPELAKFMLQLPCDEAMNLDGGGSAEVWMDGKVLNSPCYGYERKTANGIVLLQKARPGREGSEDEID